MAPSLLQTVQASFNTFKNFHVSQDLISGSHFIDQYSQALNEVQESFGTVDWASLNFTEAQRAAEWAKGNIAGVGIEMLGHAARVGIDMAGAAAVPLIGPMGTGLAILLGEVVDRALTTLGESYEHEAGALVEGDWVIYDMTGEFRRRRRRLYGGGLEATMALEIEEVEGIHTQTQSVGQNAHLGIFLLGGKGGKNDTEIFDVESGHTIWMAPNHLHRVSNDDQSKIDNMGGLHALKDALQKKRKAPVPMGDQVRSKNMANVNVGDNVVFDGYLAVITERLDEHRFVVDSNGNTYEATIDELQPALSSSTARPMRHGTVETSFTQRTVAYNAGDWVFYTEVGMEENQVWYLGVIHVTRGSQALVFCASDHLENPQWFEVDSLRKWTEQPGSQGGQSSLAKFRMAVIEGDTYQQQVNLPSGTHPQFVTIVEPAALEMFADQPRVFWQDYDVPLAGTGHLATYEVSRPVEETMRLRGGALSQTELAREEGGGITYERGTGEPKEAKAGNMGLMIGAVVIIGLGLTFYS